MRNCHCGGCSGRYCGLIEKSPCLRGEGERSDRGIKKQTFYNLYESIHVLVLKERLLYTLQSEFADKRHKFWFTFLAFRYKWIILYTGRGSVQMRCYVIKND